MATCTRVPKSTSGAAASSSTLYCVVAYLLMTKAYRTSSRKSGMYVIAVSLMSAGSCRLDPADVVVDPMKRVTRLERRPVASMASSSRRRRRRRRVTPSTRHRRRHRRDATSTAPTPSRRCRRRSRAHAWFQQKLPPYLRHAPDRIENLERVIDEDTVDDVLALASRGFAPSGRLKTTPGEAPDQSPSFAGRGVGTEAARLGRGPAAGRASAAGRREGDPRRLRAHSGPQADKVANGGISLGKAGRF